MQTDKSSHSPSAAGAVSPASAPALSDDALARRRMLMKSLGKGAAVVAAASPLQTLAGPTLPGTERLCTVSGIQSSVGSGRTGGTTAQCSGYSPTHFATPGNFPAPFTVGTVSVSDQQTFNLVFGSGNAIKLIDVFLPPTGVVPTTSERVWTAALLSAHKKFLEGYGPSQVGQPGYFPYTPQEIIDLYQSPGRLEAEGFLAGYVQQVD